MYRDGKSDRFILPQKPTNKEDGAPPSAETVEGRSLTKGKTFQQSKFRTLSRDGEDMEDSKRARSEKSRIQPRAYSYVPPVDLQTAWNGYGRGCLSGQRKPSLSRIVSVRHYLR